MAGSPISSTAAAPSSSAPGIWLALQRSQPFVDCISVEELPITKFQERQRVDRILCCPVYVEASLPHDLQVWAEELAAKFAASFHAARASLTTEELRLLEETRA
jgi:hypothetical protein